MGGRSGTGVGGCGTGGRRRLQVSLRCSAAPHSTPLHHSHMPARPHSTCHSCHHPAPPMHARDAHGGGGGDQSPPPHGPSTCPTIPPHIPHHMQHTRTACACSHCHTHALSHPPLAGGSGQPPRRTEGPGGRRWRGGGQEQSRIEGRLKWDE